MSRKPMNDARTVRLPAALSARFEAHVRRVALRAGVPVSAGDVHRALLEAALTAEEVRDARGEVREEAASGCEGADAERQAATA